MTRDDLHRAVLVAVALVPIGLGCSRDSSRKTPTVLQPPPLPSVSVTPPAYLSDAAENVFADMVRARVDAWSHALDTHDVAALDGLYASRVCLYGRVVPHAAVLDAKRMALATHGTFRQEIVGPQEVLCQPDGATVVLFTKRSGPSDHARETSAKLVLRPRPGAPRTLEVTEEADAPDRVAAARRDSCEARAVDPAATGDRCESTASAVVNALPAVKDFAAHALVGAPPGTELGGLGPEDDDAGVLTASIGLHTPERFEARVVYTVDRGAGTLTVTFDGQDLAVPDEARRAVAGACRR